MDEEIKIEYLEPICPTLSEAEWLGRFMAGEWVPTPVRHLTREELEKEFPSR